MWLDSINLVSLYMSVEMINVYLAQQDIGELVLLLWELEENSLR